MSAETRSCQSCKAEFVIEPDDFGFYERINVPPPTFCPQCRFQRRMAWRNEWSLYSRECDLCHKRMIAMYPKDAPFPVYCHDCWWSDKWDATDYGKEYDFSKPFFEQFRELFNAVPRLALFQRNSTNSEYSNMVAESKNVYLSASVVLESDTVYYSKFIDRSTYIFDSYSVVGSELGYENVYADKIYNCHFSQYVRECTDSWFLFDCVGCQNCVLSSNLRNKRFVIRNKQYSEEDYRKELEKLNFGDREGLQAAKKEFLDIKNAAVHRYANIIKSTASTGNDIRNVKNAKTCFDVHDCEDLRYCYRAVDLRQSMDLDYGGLGSELLYEYHTGAKSDYNIKFSASALEGARDCEYVDYCVSASSLFGCIGMRSKENCVLNRQYTKEEYAELVARVKEHMEAMPYEDKKGRIYKYGEFPPAEFSPFAYNESTAFEHMPLAKEQAEEKGFFWRDMQKKEHKATIDPADIPGVSSADESILKEIIGCAHKNECEHQCTGAFKIAPEELKFYKRTGIALPWLCPACRFQKRLFRVNPHALWPRKCMCDYRTYKNSIKHQHHLEEPCPNEFQTTYAPGRPEIVYCEQCYQAEVV